MPAISGNSSIGRSGKNAFAKVKEKLIWLNHKVEKLAYDRLPKRVAEIALKLLKALPVALLLVAVPQPITVGCIATGLVASFISPDVFKSALGVAVSNGIGLATGFYAVTNAVQMVATEHFLPHFVMASLHLGASFFAFNQARHLEAHEARQDHSKNASTKPSAE